MTLEEFKEILEQIGLPVAYHAFRERQEPPYICYTEPGSDNFMADGKVYLQIKELNVELYSRYRAPDLEKRIEEVLQEFSWQKTVSFIESEGVFQTIYELEV